MKPPTTAAVLTADMRAEVHRDRALWPLAWRSKVPWTYLDLAARAVRSLRMREREIARLELRVADLEIGEHALRYQLERAEEAEAACCPEDVGFAEYIAALEKRNAELRSALRDCARAMRLWGAEEDGIPEDGPIADAYEQAAKLAEKT